MGLKYNNISWDDNGLMYVSFRSNSKVLRWYPKWADLVGIFRSAVTTEDGINDGRLNVLFAFVCLDTLIRSLFRQEAPYSDEILQYNQLAGRIETLVLQSKKHRE